ncbi:glycosyltransferase family 4 protein [Anabaena cylindrica FACHB-243]|uniref:Glycosyl transferase group 1 n=1 Tax=Anabaena cylindrica (strain ATCC 27899 / PCC 7122) TaxID=272123 RepID=K9ZJW1_ANACC|nr:MULTISPECIES: glycosyltransferase family 4 protein [Anabaena]AFZ59059.1 glycosyl transferase group 1 [Anabaena cylindrica PCC 7122]MBD2420602.1 glycosyltransferase family 4 protein [Anabaena cylindrica FACHB-243]MBY5282353.1 glycosyltransferase family 4 protein [Anabaena sp. CCAP 1446/1C]MBY5309236.1 glycosyltransferase family 4 protein [Anabaena sp. CCAP 1446/1C]MCM2408560.1 glycosyltransferase family 4 protein [Anabaena sp. CCAP 1446/1C]
MLTFPSPNPIVVRQLNKSLTFIFISSCEYWGGSEELWFESARYLKRQGFTVHALKNRVPKNNHIQELKADGIEVKNIHFLVQVLRKLSFLINIQFFVKTIKLFKYKNNHRLFKNRQPSLVIISQGENYDGVEIAKICLELNLPYIIISHKASDPVWPHGIKRQIMQDVYRQAKFCFFVSQHNLSLTEAQIGYSLTNAEVVRNPHQAIIPEALPYPQPENDYFKIACVARLWILDKGQDVLLRVLAQDKWQNRHLHISFFGEGVDRDALIDMTKLLGLKNVSFPGFVNNILNIWYHHHALIMPSRAEGLPIALVEAMMCGRPGIVTDVGGMAEILEDEVTGFIAAGACFQEIDKVLERAWQRRYEWENIGKEASISIRKLIPPQPEQVFADKLVQLCQSSELL